MKKSISFYVEIFVLLLVLLAACMLLVQMFGAAGNMSEDAAGLTTAVRLAQNTAEQFAAEKAPAVDTVQTNYDRQGNAVQVQGVYTVHRTVWQDADTAGLLRARIEVAQGEEILYTLETANFIRKE